MFFLWGTGDENVIDKIENEIEATEDSVYEPLKGLSSIVQPEWHTAELIQTEGCKYGCFGNVVFMNWDLIVCMNQIDIGENSIVCEVCDKVLYVGNRIGVGGRLVVQ